MLRGNRQRVLSLWIIATGLVIATLGVIGYCSGHLVSVFGDRTISAIILTGIGLILGFRGLVLFRREHRFPPSE